MAPARSDRSGRLRPVCLPQGCLASHPDRGNVPTHQQLGEVRIAILDGGNDALVFDDRAMAARADAGRDSAVEPQQGVEFAGR
jgi:hypothetical protein